MSKEQRFKILSAVIFIGLVSLGIYLRIAFISHGLPKLDNFENPDEIDFFGPSLNLVFNLSKLTGAGGFLSFINTDYFYGHPQGYTNLLFVLVTIFKEVWQIGHKLLPSLLNDIHTWTRPDFFNLARVFTALITALVPIVLFKFGRKYFDNTVAWISLILSVFCYYLIFYAHTISPYNVSALFNLFFMYCFFRLYEKNSIKNIVLVGISFGIALAMNSGALILALPLLIIFGALIFRKEATVTTTIRNIALIGILTGFTFVILSPATIIYFQKTIMALKGISDTMRSGCVSDVRGFGPWQYFFGNGISIETLPLLNPSSFKEALGWPGSILLAAATIWGLLYKNRKIRLLCLSFVLGVIFYSGTNSMALRRLLPFMPLMIPVIAALVVEIYKLAAKKSRVLRIFCCSSLLIILIAPSGINTYIFLNASQQIDTREEAANWIVGNLSGNDLIFNATSYASPPLYKYGLNNVVEIGYPHCGSTYAPLNKSLAPILQTVFCQADTLEYPRRYLVVNSSIASAIISQESEKYYPDFYKSWVNYFASVSKWKLVKVFDPKVSSPKIGPLIKIYEIPLDLNCEEYLKSVATASQPSFK
ncbi:MAG: glycosyltransferase family 39 protein [candidate division WWE3 bacterium]|nr:glycosyltransferase family 39 protein [candidate division WWE3 bacterium]